MAQQKVIAVVGATGQQGGGLVEAILADTSGEFTVRALTRDAGSPKAKALASRGAEVVEADLDDEASLVAAFDGAFGVFVMTNFWADLTPEQEAARSRVEMELEQAANAARAAKAAGVKHAVWSSVEDTRPFFERTGDKVPRPMAGYTVPHMDVKAAADAFFTDLGVPTTFLLTSWFYENLFIGMGPVRNEAGELILTIPLAHHKLAAHAATDIGRTVLGMFKSEGAYIGKTVGIAGAHVTGEEMAAVLSEAVGEKVTYQPFTWDQFRGFGFPHAVEFANNLQYMAQNDTEFTAARDIEWSRSINPQLESFRSWAEAHSDQLRALNS
ncbi:NmrA/HSCARG family protein [Streptomyces sp. NBC_01341]|uniref:NmrA/HSCARG family protein n=1 Tax=Streptomyces sp. NBC_01341 TaxID=2903831 RepID=UPI002E1593C7|nr:NmrA/HSCARG family protein [Streptomyces sp. NBC_01341]